VPKPRRNGKPQRPGEAWKRPRITFDKDVDLDKLTGLSLTDRELVEKWRYDRDHQNQAALKRPVNRQEWGLLLDRVLKIESAGTEDGMAKLHQEIREHVDKVDREYQERMWAIYPDVARIKRMALKLGWVKDPDEWDRTMREVSGPPKRPTLKQALRQIGYLLSQCIFVLRGLVRRAA
jgi:hypothetical protein